MNYLKDITLDYLSITNFSNPIAFYNDGTDYTMNYGNMTSDLTTIDKSPVEYMVSIMDFYNERSSHLDENLVAFYMPDNYNRSHEGYLFVNQFIDYALITSLYNYQVSLNSVTFDETLTSVSTISDAMDVNESYLQLKTNGLSSYPLDYDEYSLSFTALNQTQVIDYHFFENYQDFEHGDFFQFQQYRQNLYQKNVIKLISPDLSTCEIKVQLSNKANSDLIGYAQNGYDAGLIEGQSIGYANGFDAGVEIGKTMVGDINAFTYISNSFQALENILALQVLPNVTIGIIVSVPFMLAMIGVIFKLIKK